MEALSTSWVNAERSGHADSHRSLSSLPWVATMGPITLFDKSFLQSLSEDESVWFDHFFSCNVCPMFFVETLADLEKDVDGRTPEQEVSLIAAKFPEVSGTPSVHHSSLLLGNLMGEKVPLTGQIMLAGGRVVKSGETTAIVYDKSPEAGAFARWMHGEFLETERSYAKGWRDALASVDLVRIGRTLNSLGITGKSCRTMKQAWVFADWLVMWQNPSVEPLNMVLLFQNIPREYHLPVVDRWKAAGCPPIVSFAPYAAHVLKVDLFFHVALAASLISGDRPSNRVDIAYLYYLPFCKIFVSNDKLHRDSASFFLRSDQEFVWGGELKSDLKRLNRRYLGLPEETKSQGVSSFAHNPPKDGGFLVASLWDRHFGNWRDRGDDLGPRDKEEESRLLKEINALVDAPAVSDNEAGVNQERVDVVSIQHMVRRKKGSWWQVPSDLKE